MFPQLVDNWSPILVSLIATQKTKATRRTIRVYSTRPCPSSSTINLLKSSIIIHPLSLREATKFVLITGAQDDKTIPDGLFLPALAWGSTFHATVIRVCFSTG